MPSHPAGNSYEARQERLRLCLEKRRLAAVVLTHGANIFYLTGFRGSAGVAAFGLSEAVLWVDPRYTLLAQEKARGVEVVEERHGVLKAAGRWLRKWMSRSVGFEDLHLTCAALQQLKSTSRPNARLVPVGDLVQALRYVKDAAEIELIRGAARLTSAVFDDVRPLVRPGVCESDLAAEIEYRMKKKRADGAAFETIVASGRRSALPHARPSSNILTARDLVVFDLGAKLDGYCADMTRTIYLGKPTSRVERLYKAVVEAQKRAVEALRAGAKADHVDAAARRVLGRHGLAQYFTHSTGHGVGLEIHEEPRLAQGQKRRLESGCVVTAEPGIYLEGFGGIRIEDTVLIGAHGPEILTLASKEHWHDG